MLSINFITYKCYNWQQFKNLHCRICIVALSSFYAISHKYLKKAGCNCNTTLRYNFGMCVISRPLTDCLPVNDRDRGVCCIGHRTLWHPQIGCLCCMNHMEENSLGCHCQSWITVNLLPWWVFHLSQSTKEYVVLGASQNFKSFITQQSHYQSNFRSHF